MVYLLNHVLKDFIPIMGLKFIFIVSICILVIFSNYCLAFAEDFSKNETGVDSKVISLASNSVPPPSYLNIPPELITRTLKKRDPEFVISVNAILQKIKNKEEAILIDVRNHQKFEKFRIPGSINIPLFAIKTKVFLKSKPLILVNEGYNHVRLEQESRRLKKSGFTGVWILSGGLNVWKQKGGPLIGDIFAQKELNKISPHIFFEEKNDTDCLMIDVTETKNPDVQYLIPQAVVIPLADNSQEFILKIREATYRHKKDPFSSVLIFNQSGEQYGKIDSLIQKTELQNVFYLKDGLNGYKTFLQRQALIWQANNHSKKMLKKCANCP